jgi:sugar phosphate isomerase/epimerase
MGRPVTLFTGQWADLSITDMVQKAKACGYDGLELACWGDHMEVNKADQAYCDAKRELLESNGMQLHAISAHLVGQAVSDNIDERHKSILPDYVWGDGNPADVNKRAADEMIATAEAAKRLGVSVVNGFTGSPIWHLLYAFPPTSQEMVDAGYAKFAATWKPILDAYQELGIKFGLEVHPTEIAFDTVSAENALAAVDNHPAFGFNYDPSHLGYQGVDYVDFIYRFGSERIFHAHMKDVTWADGLVSSGVFGGHLPFGDPRRYWEFRSVGRGKIDFERIIRALNDIEYTGPLSVEWEDGAMDREHGATESCAFVKQLDFKPSANRAFDAAFDND